MGKIVQCTETYRHEKQKVIETEPSLHCAINFSEKYDPLSKEQKLTRLITTHDLLTGSQFTDVHVENDLKWFMLS